MNKKAAAFTLLLFLVMLPLVPALQVHASAVTVWIEPSSQEVKVGQEFTATVYVDPGGCGVSGGEINLNFGADAMEIADVEPGGLLGSDPLVGVKQIDNEAGKIRYALARSGPTTPPTPPGDFATVRFNVKAEGTCQLTLSRVGLADESFEDVSGIMLEHGSVSVLPASAKLSTSLSLSMSANQIDKGESIRVSGMISPAVSGKIVSLTFEKAGEVMDTRMVTVASDGSFASSYVPDAGGSWGVTASWDGDEDYEGATSAPASFEVVDKGCVIATSSYGSELALEVQFLRGFRENTVYSTFAGSNFMVAFNAFYYSWSPTIAGQIWGSEVLQGIGRVLISPLLGILHVSTLVNSAVGFGSEVGIIIAGLTASVLIGVVYFAPITAVALYAVKRKRGSLPRIGQMRLVMIPWIASVLLIAYGEIVPSPFLMTLATGLLVVFTIALASGTIALKVAQHLPNHR